MAKLQIYISRSLRGHSSLLNINPEGDVSRHIVDFRSALECIEYDNDKSNVFYLVSFIENGLLFTVIRTIPSDEQNAYNAASLFIHDGITLSTNDFLDKINLLSSILPTGGSRISADDTAELRETFSRDYHIEADAPSRVASYGHSYAYVYFGGQNLSFIDYAKAGFYQPRFSRFAGIIFIDHLSGAKGKERRDDLTPNKLVKMTTLLPPGKTREGFTPYIYHHVFDKPVLIPVDTDIELRWHRAGFDSVTQKVRATDPTQPLQVTPPETSDTVKVITPSLFYITEQGSQRTVGTYIVKVNGIEIDQPHPFPYNELKNARVEINSPGYFAFSGTLDLATTAQALIQLKQLRRTYRFDLPLHTPDPTEAIRIYLKTTKPITECPVDGYAVAGGEITEGAGVSNSLYYVGGRGKKFKQHIAALIAIAFVLGFLIGWITFNIIGKSPAPHTAAPVEQTAGTPATASNPAEEAAVLQVETTVPQQAAEPTAEAQTLEADTTAPADYTAAVKYLDGHKNWKHDDMEAIPGIQGLYDDINTYNFDRIINYWAPLLDASRNFSAVVTASRNSASKRSPRQAPHTPTYITDNSGTVNWLSYTYWIDP